MNIIIENSNLEESRLIANKLNENNEYILVDFDDFKHLTPPINAYAQYNLIIQRFLDSFKMSKERNKNVIVTGLYDLEKSEIGYYLFGLLYPQGFVVVSPTGKTSFEGFDVVDYNFKTEFIVDLKKKLDAVKQKINSNFASIVKVFNAAGFIWYGPSGKNLQIASGHVSVPLYYQEYVSILFENFKNAPGTFAEKDLMKFEKEMYDSGAIVRKHHPIEVLASQQFSGKK